MTTGIVLVAFFAANAAGVPRAKIRSTLRAINFGDQRREPARIAVGRSVLEDEVLPLDVAEVLQRQAEGSKVSRVQLR